MQNSAIKRILGAHRSTSVWIIEKKTAFPLTDIGHQRIQLMKAIRLDRNNPLNSNLNSGNGESLVNTLEAALQNISEEAVPKSYPIWEKAMGP